VQKIKVTIQRKKRYLQFSATSALSYLTKIHAMVFTNKMWRLFFLKRIDVLWLGDLTIGEDKHPCCPVSC
jgi:hypothetical protein